MDVNYNEDASSSKQNTKRRYLLTTVAIYLGNIATGSCSTSYAPTMDYFADKYNKDVATVSYGATFYIFSYLVGSLLVAFVYKFITRQLGVIIFLFGISVSITLLWHCPTLEFMYAQAVGMGICMGAYDTSQIVWMMEMWQAKCGPFVQGQYFFTSIGAFIPGFLMAPFLSQLEAEGQTGDPMWIPFTTLGVYAAIAASAQLLLYIYQPYSPPPPETVIIDVKTEQHNGGGETVHSTETKWTTKKIILVALSAVFIAFYLGMDLNSGQYMSAFAQFGVHEFSPAEGSILYSAHATSITVGRFIGIFAIFKIPPLIILGCNFLILTVANTLLVISNTNKLFLWIGAIGLGLGLSTVQASFSAFIERHLVITNVIGSILLVTAGSVGGIYPIIIGPQIQTNSLFYTYVNFFSLSVIVIALGLILWIISKKKPGKL